MRGELGNLQGDGDVRVAHPPAAFADEGDDLRQQDLAVDAFPLGGRVREEMADVPEGQRPENGVAEGVDRDVSVRVRHETDRRGDVHPAQPHGQPFFEGVHVVSVSDSEFHDHKGNEKNATFVS